MNSITYSNAVFGCLDQSDSWIRIPENQQAFPPLSTYFLCRCIICKERCRKETISLLRFWNKTKSTSQEERSLLQHTKKRITNSWSSKTVTSNDIYKLIDQRLLTLFYFWYRVVVCVKRKWADLHAPSCRLVFRSAMVMSNEFWLGSSGDEFYVWYGYPFL